MNEPLYQLFVVVELVGAGGRKFAESNPVTMKTMIGRFPNAVKIYAFDMDGKPAETWKNDPKNHAPIIGHTPDQIAAIQRRDHFVLS
jgi:hypothetical protein